MQVFAQIFTITIIHLAAYLQLKCHMYVRPNCYYCLVLLSIFICSSLSYRQKPCKQVKSCLTTRHELNQVQFMQWWCKHTHIVSRKHPSFQLHTLADTLFHIDTQTHYGVLTGLPSHPLTVYVSHANFAELRVFISAKCFVHSMFWLTDVYILTVATPPRLLQLILLAEVRGEPCGTWRGHACHCVWRWWIFGRSSIELQGLLA